MIERLYRSGTNGADGEADLDAEGCQRGRAQRFHCCRNVCGTPQRLGGLLAIQISSTSSTPPAIISLSYGECEAFNGAASNASFNSAYQTAAGVGTSVFVSTGDSGAAGCTPLFGEDFTSVSGIGITGWGETAYNVAVGGTDFEDDYNALIAREWRTSAEHILELDESVDLWLS